MSDERKVKMLDPEDEAKVTEVYDRFSEDLQSPCLCTDDCALLTMACREGTRVLVVQATDELQRIVISAAVRRAWEVVAVEPLVEEHDEQHLWPSWRREV